jgi:hypothetical protein
VADSGLKTPGAAPGVAAAGTGTQTKTSPGDKAGASASSASTDAVGSARPPSDPVERSAIEAALGGRWQDALVLYDRLALSRPDEPAFREAARIIREDKLRPK